MFAQFGFNQTFVFDMFFEDSAGNKDTLTIGYDPTATDGIDSNFGKINIINTPLDSNFDVRISDEYYLGGIIGNQSFHTKKNIVLNNNCSDVNVISLNIKTDNWPVTATWDSTLFDNSCLSGSAFNSMIQWFDVAGESDLLMSFLNSKDSVVFSANQGVGYYNENCSFINSNNDTISVFQIILSNTDYLVSVKEYSLKPIEVYPNPFSNVLNLIFDELIDGKLMIYDITGQLIYVESVQNRHTLTINTNKFDKGVYLYKVIDITTGFNINVVS